MTAPIAVERLRPAHAGELARLFEGIARDPAGTGFHPHAFTGESARTICNHPGRDLYFAVRDGETFVAYGMLRGWDEGYDVPSLGIYVAPAARRTGTARAFMEYLHGAARAMGAERVRLKVYPDNVAARRLYESLGYRMSAQQEGGQLVGLKELGG